MADFDLLYINLDRSADRRLALEQNLGEANFSSAWRSQRFAAIEAGSDHVAAMPGTASGSLKGNWLSHVGCMWEAISKGWKSHLIIAEDDAKFSSKAEELINLAVKQLGPNDWDVIFLDLIIGRALDMPYFFSLRQSCAMNGTSILTDMKSYHRRFALAGAGAYVINNASLIKVFSNFNLSEISAAFDIVMRHLITTDAIKAVAIFPFPVTVNLLGDAPSVDHADDWVYECSLMHEFRRLIWTESDMELRKRPIKRGEITPDVERFQSIFSRLLTIQHGVV